MHHEAINTLIIHQEAITSTQKDTSFYVESHTRENHKFFLFFFFSSLHRFESNVLLEEPTPKICKMLFLIGCNLIEALTWKMCKQQLTISYNLIGKTTSKNVQATNHCRLQPH